MSLRGILSPERLRFLRFLAVGASGVPVNLGIVYVATALVPGSVGIAVRDAIAFVLGVAVSILTNFLLNNAWTFADRVREGAGGGFFARLAKFYVVSTVAAMVQVGTSVSLSEILRGSDLFSTTISGEYRLYHMAAPLAGIALGLAVNYLANNLWTFRRNRTRT